MRIYLDVCCLNRPFDDQSQERVRLEAEAVLVILRRIESAQWELVGSEVVDFELDRVPDAERRERVRALARMSVTNHAIDHAVRIRAGRLVAAGLKPVDAMHLACAEAMSVDVFLTTDDRLLRAIRRLVDVRIPANNPLPWLHDVLA